MALENFLINEVKNLCFKTVKADESLVKSGLLSSITIVDLAVTIEDTYGVKIPFTDITYDNFDTVELIIKFLRSKGVTAE